MYYIGQANDIHKLVLKNNSLVTLGGYKFKSNYKIIAHSDGDLVLHAIANAIFGAIQAGDIGEHFDDKDPKTKDVDSKTICDFALNMLKKRKCEISNIDLTIICENIFLREHKKFIAESISEIVGCKKVNVKATRFEKRCSMIQCNCSLLIKD